MSQLLATMKPELNPRPVAFLSFPDGKNPIAPEHTISTFAEAEGLTVVADLAEAEKLGAKIWMRAAWITLTVHSDLAAVGLTAAFSKALTDVGISANVMAGAYHDHIFVGLDDAERAMQAIQQLQQRSRR
nr:ACT domain-containing protein [Aestuariivirga litoralis]